MENKFVIFELAGDHYGVNIDAVEEVIEVKPMTKFPYAPVFIEGVTNLRGQILSVFDLRKRLELPARVPTKDTRILVVMVEEMLVGMIVDAVLEVRAISEADIEPPPAIVMTVRATFITGIAKAKDENESLTILLNLPRVLSTKEEQDLRIFEEKIKTEALETP
ncbi:MAG: chemotaxis protein CheW [Anaerolineae bacterium]|nr:chemotaxis protein CheW [Anaerolineae bacterium]